MSVISGTENAPLVLFSKPLVVEAMREFLREIEGELSGVANANRESLHFMKKFVWLAIREIISRPREFDESCEFNISLFSQRFVDELKLYGTNKKYAVSLFCYCYRFAAEFELKSETGLSEALRIAWQDITNLELSEYPEAKSQVSYANGQMTIQIVRSFLRDPAIDNFKSFAKNVDLVKHESLEFDRLYLERESRVSELEKRLKRSEQEYNFANLNNGFNGLKQAKVKEKILTLVAIWFFGALLLALPLVKLFGLLPTSENISLEIPNIIALFGVEILLVYFFRVLLHNFRSVKLQILQIDLRMTLCSFIESYIDFATEARKSDKESLSRFEQLVFSEVIAGDSGLPSTFDGFEHISSIVGRLKPN
ncbi:hypothetical protein HBN83_02200 [Pseudomonas fragi]|uniref:hypothetical protein n=1 Tax=Pseudomonas fragi TaxID=296 RepID=UPI001472A7E6|nr:hypothetical protein [Pseudomonas fragi]NNB04709.1 hypothetical protein [Pseudomonas fragi]